MRTTIDLPEDTYRQIEARAALEGLSVQVFVARLLQLGLSATPVQARSKAPRSAPPKIVNLEPFPLGTPSNATLFEVLDDPDGTNPQDEPA